MQLQVQNFIFYAFVLVSVLYVIHLGLYLITANLYDIWHCRLLNQRRLNTHPQTRLLEQPVPSSQHKPDVTELVSIGIAAHNEEKVIVRCLDSILQSTYPAIEIIVANDCSQDVTHKLVRDYILRHPGVNLQVYRISKHGRNVGKGTALNTILKRYAKGTYVMMLDADSMVRPDTVANAVAYFENPAVVGVAANVQIIDDPTVLGVLQKFEHMVGYRSKKMYSLLNCEFVVGGVASSYRMSVLKEVGFYSTDTVTEDIGLSTKVINLGNLEHRVIYAADVVAMTEGVPSFRALVRQRYRWKYGSFQNLVKYHRLMGNPSPLYSRSLTMYRMPMAFLSEFTLLIAPLAWSYILYMTFVQYNLTLIIGAYLTITAYMLITIWFDENLKLVARLQLSFYAFISYFIFFIMDVVQLVCIIRCLFNSRHLLRQKDIGSSWVSPKRVGKKMRHAYDT